MPVARGLGAKLANKFKTVRDKDGTVRSLNRVAANSRLLQGRIKITPKAQRAKDAFIRLTGRKK